MTDEMQELKLQIKKNISELVATGKLQEAQQLLGQYRNMAQDDIEVFSIQAVIAIHAGELIKARDAIETGLKIDKQNFDLLYNEAYVFELQEQYTKAVAIYLQLTDLVVYSSQEQALAQAALERLNEYIPKSCNNKKKIIFFAKPGMDSFLENVIDGLSDTYETKKMIVNDAMQIVEGMQWADICWFEWCDELVIYGSTLEIAKERKVVCRLHSYEAFTEYPSKVNWATVDQVIFVAEHIKKVVLDNAPALSAEKAVVIPNGVDINKYSFKERKAGFSIAYVGYINYKKGPMLLLHAFKAIYDRDHRYKLYIAGTFQDERDVLYFRQTIEKMGLSHNVIYEGWQDDINSWLENKNYILCTSVLESQGMGIMQAMSKGIKPIIHNFVGAEQIYTSKYVWTTIDECISAIRSKQYSSREYRAYVEEKFSLNLELNRIKKMLSNDSDENVQKDAPLVTVGIINYNYAHYLDDSINSVLTQSYNALEILVVDDCSTDDSRLKIKAYEQKENNIRGIYHKKNSGSAALAIREFIQEAQGEYLVILSADDFLASNTIIEELVREAVSDEQLDYIYCNANVVDQYKKPKDVWKYKQYTETEIIFETFNRYGSGVIPITIGLFRTDFFYRNKLTWYDEKENKIAPGSLNLAADTLSVLKYGKVGWKVRHFDKSLICYRHHENNMTYNLKSRITSILSVLEYVVHNFDEQIYFPQVEWNTYEQSEKISLKMFLIGVHYYNMFNVYYGGKWNPLQNGNSILFTEEETKLFLQPIVEHILYYFAKSIDFSHSFEKEINEIKEKFTILGYRGVEPAKYLTSMIFQEDIVYEGQKLRNELLGTYKNKYSNKNYKLLIFSPDNGAWKYTFQSWKSILEHMGVCVDIVYSIDSEGHYDDYTLFLVIANQFYIDQFHSNGAINKISNKIGIAAKDSFSPQNSKNDIEVLNYLLAEPSFKFLLSSSNDSGIQYVFSDWLDKGIKIYSNPFGFNPLIHFPEYVQQDSNYFFVGHNSYLKAEETQKYLQPIFENYKGGILGGTGWGTPVHEINPQDVRSYYNRSKINLNYHLDIQKQYENEVNERTYIICACGGFQLVDNPKYLRYLYNETEVAIAQNEKQYLELFAYYLKKPEERLTMAYNALVKTYKNKSSLFHRLDDVLRLLS